MGYWDPHLPGPHARYNILVLDWYDADQTALADL